MTRRQEALHLYKRILRAGRVWQGLPEDKAYIFAEARKQFRANEQASEHQTEALLAAGEQRLEYAEHYQNPYPRIHHASQFYKRQYMDSPQQDDAEASNRSRSSDGISKLAAAAERRKHKTAGASRPSS